MADTAKKHADPRAGRRRGGAAELAAAHHRESAAYLSECQLCESAYCVHLSVCLIDAAALSVNLQLLECGGARLQSTLGASNCAQTPLMCGGRQTVYSSGCLWLDQVCRPCVRVSGVLASARASGMEGRDWPRILWPLLPPNGKQEEERRGDAHQHTHARTPCTSTRSFHRGVRSLLPHSLISSTVLHSRARMRDCFHPMSSNRGGCTIAQAAI